MCVCIYVKIYIKSHKSSIFIVPLNTTAVTEILLQAWIRRELRFRVCIAIWFLWRQRFSETTCILLECKHMHIILLLVIFYWCQDTVYEHVPVYVCYWLRNLMCCSQFVVILTYLRKWQNHIRNCANCRIICHFTHCLNKRIWHQTYLSMTEKLFLNSIWKFWFLNRLNVYERWYI